MVSHENAARKLSVMLKGVTEVSEAHDCVVTSVCIDSRQIEKNSLFIAMKGVSYHGLQYLTDAMSAGACCVIYDLADTEKYAELLSKAENDIHLIAVSNVKEIAGLLLNRFYEEASKKMQIAAVTGTDGKTSVTRFLAQAMSAQTKSAVIGTAGNGLWGAVTESTHTTPDMVQMHKLLAGFYEQGAEFVAMEVSSHGIDQNRIAGVDIDTAILTNVSRDHLDYHGSEENYRNVKKQLFRLPVIKNIVINSDDRVGLELAAELVNEKNTWVYGFNAETKKFPQHVFVEHVNTVRTGFEVFVTTPKGRLELSVPLLGRFNISNVLAVVAVLLINGVSFEQIAEQIAGLQTAPGRMEMIIAENSAVFVVDYAHTPKALELALQSLREHFSGKTWCVFGCGGDRDKGKRALMGEQAEQHADVIVLTDDNPRSESSEEIIDQILSGIQDSSALHIISDREKAIAYACQHAKRDDVVLVAGKGHETYQQTGDKKIPFDDREVVRRCLGRVS